MDAELAKQEIRWRTSIHELLHSVPVGYTPTDYNALLGWEEGVVEQLQRLTRPEILQRISVAVTEEVFQVWEAQHPFNRHIAALEQMRTVLSLPDVLFYIGLLRTPIRDKPAYLFDLGSRQPDAERIAFVKVYAVASAILRIAPVLRGRPLCQLLTRNSTQAKPDFHVGW